MSKYIFLRNSSIYKLREIKNFHNLDVWICTINCSNVQCCNETIYKVVKFIHMAKIVLVHGVSGRDREKGKIEGKYLQRKDKNGKGKRERVDKKKSPVYISFWSKNKYPNHLFTSNIIFCLSCWFIRLYYKYKQWIANLCCHVRYAFDNHIFNFIT